MFPIRLDSHLFRTLALTLAVTGLGACSSTGSLHPSADAVQGSALQPGATQVQVRAQRGEPFAIYETETGAYWFYDTGTRILQRDRLAFDTEGRLLSQGSAWSRAAFEQIELQQWHSSDLLHHFGPPIQQERLRTSLFGDASAPARPGSASPQPEAQARDWIYGFRESQRYFTVTITVAGDGLVTGIEVTDDAAHVLF